MAYEDEETQEQFPHGDCYASDYHPNSESESDFDDQIVSLASSPVPTTRGRQAALASIPSSQVGPSGVRVGIRPGTPRPSKQVSSEVHVMPFLDVLCGTPCPNIGALINVVCTTSSLAWQYFMHVYNNWWWFGWLWTQLCSVLYSWMCNVHNVTKHSIVDEAEMISILDRLFNDTIWNLNCHTCCGIACKWKPDLVFK